MLQLKYKSLLHDNFTMLARCYIVWYVYNHIEIQNNTHLNLLPFLCIVSTQMEAEYISKISIWISIFLIGIHSMQVLPSDMDNTVTRIL